MGFDVSGVNPQINKPETEYKYYREDSDIWKTKDESKRKKYFDEMDEYHRANPGVYFRNNVWWWRPLWGFVCMQCDFMTDKQKEGGHYNDGKLIDQETAAKIGTKLKILLEDGTVDRWEDHIKTRNEELKKSGNKEEQFAGNYPFNRDNVEHFADFCLQSGGFEIC